MPTIRESIKSVVATLRREYQQKHGAAILSGDNEAAKRYELILYRLGA